MTKIILLCLLLTLSGCGDNESEKILQELKELNHRHAHQYKMQLLLRKHDDELQAATSHKEKMNILHARHVENEKEVLWYKNKIKKELIELQKINKKNFTGTFSINLRAYALEESKSLFSGFIKMLILVITPNKHDSDIREFQRLSDSIVYMQVQSSEYYHFPRYIPLAQINSMRDAPHAYIKFPMKSNNELLSSEIEYETGFIELHVKYLKEIDPSRAEDYLTDRN